MHHVTIANSDKHYCKWYILCSLNCWMCVILYVMLCALLCVRLHVVLHVTRCITILCELLDH